jgi:hypothetical protein
MKSNLISIGQLLEKIYVVKIEDNVLRVFDRKMRLILKAPVTKQRTIKIEFNVIEGNRLLTTASDEDWIWH